MDIQVKFLKKYIEFQRTIQEEHREKLKEIVTNNKSQKIKKLMKF